MSKEGADSFVDPYVYPGTNVLRNLLNKHTKEALDQVEYRLTWARRIELDEDPIKGPFDFHRLKETHRRLFQDIYAWAGQPRTVEISKGGSHFHQSAYISTAAEQTFGWLAESHLPDPGISDELFVQQTAELLEKLNYIHPFRDGNGRTQRAYLDQVASISGRKLSWRNVTPDDHLRASVNAFRDGHGEAFRSIIRQAMHRPIEGFSRLDERFYAVSSPAVTTPPPNLDDRFAKYPELRNMRTPKGLAGRHPQLFEEGQSSDPEEPQLGS